MILMNTILRLMPLCLLPYASSVSADTLLFTTGRTLTGTVVKTNGDDVLVMMDFGTFNFSRANIKEVKTERAETAETRSTNRVAVFKTLLPLLAKQTWV